MSDQKVKIYNHTENHAYPGIYQFDEIFQLWAITVEVPVGDALNPNVIFPEFDDLEITEI